MVWESGAHEVHVNAPEVTFSVTFPRRVHKFRFSDFVNTWITASILITITAPPVTRSALHISPQFCSNTRADEVTGDGGRERGREGWRERDTPCT